MENTKMRITVKKSSELFGSPQGAGNMINGFIQLDVGNLPSKSLSSLIDEQKRGESKNISTQTDFDADSVSFQVRLLEEKYKAESALMQKEFAKEKSGLGIKLTKHYQGIIEDQTEQISTLTEEKDFLWEEIQNLRETFPILDKSGHSTSDLDWDPEWDHSNTTTPNKVTKPKDKTMPPISVQEKEMVLCTLMRFRKQTLMQNYKRDKQAILDKIEIEKDLIRDEITTEIESQYCEEVESLHDVIDGLKDALEDMKAQKNELAKIFQGEKNALEMEFRRKEEELKDKMARDLQRELVKAHQDWSNSKI